MRAQHPGRSGNKYTILHGRREKLCYGKVKNGAGANAGNWVYNSIHLGAQSENPAQTRVGAPLRARQNAGAGSTFTLNVYPERFKRRASSQASSPPQIVKDTDCIEVKS